MPGSLISDVLKTRCQKNPESKALIFEDISFSYKQLMEKSETIARKLNELGIGRYSRILMLLPNTSESVIAIWSVLMAGAIPVIADIKQDKVKINYLVKDCGVCGVFASAQSMLEPFQDNPEINFIVTMSENGDLDYGFDEVNGSPIGLGLTSASVSSYPMPLSIDVGMIIYTSGSTGLPKGVLLTHDNVIFSLSSIQQYLAYKSDDSVIAPLPLSFDYGLYQIFLTALSGSTLVLVKDHQLITKVCSAIAKHECTIVPAIASQYVLIQSIQQRFKFNFSSVRLVTNTGMSFTPAASSSVINIFPNAQVYLMYGLTECKRCSYVPTDMTDAPSNTIGIPIPGTEMTIVNESGEMAEIGDMGEIVVRGPNVMAGYCNSPKETALKIRPVHGFGERCLFTGDIGWRDKYGMFYLTGRKDDVVKIRGQKYVPAEIEELILLEHSVKEVAAIAVESVESELMSVLFIVGDDAEVDETYLRQKVHSLPPHQRPARCFFIEQLPKTSNGKIDRKKLRVATKGLLGELTQVGIDQPAKMDYETMRDFTAVCPT